ncbi:transglycosylase SLT domain-containing protein [Nocardia wallacei]|uniref:transglycosylase SLT domain-containing protein n=1 Tax=Nocardia wallacei TaxID=480035 RepID=UPI002458D978|nr:transglycosylase SLT domain-containing protein [Nocardia wallacei]
MVTEREGPDPRGGDQPDARASVAVAEPRRDRDGRKRTPPTPAPAASAAAKPAAASNTTAATNNGSAPAQTPSAAAASAADGAGAAAASMPMAAAAMGALVAIAAQYGSGEPGQAGQPYAPPLLPPSDAPTGPVAWDNAVSRSYTAGDQGRAGKGDAMGHLNAELSRLLGGAADDTTAGRAAVAAIIAETDAALTALGPVANTAAGQRQVIETLGNALHRAGSVLGQGQASTAVTAEQVTALANRYVSESSPTRAPQTMRRAGAAGGPPSGLPSGNTGVWINQALHILQQHGYDVRQIDPSAIAAIIQHESSGNPHAINLWDSNAAAGHPSKGLMQTIDPTFNAYALPGHRDIWNPVDNIIAGVRYSIARYGSVSDVPGIAQMRAGGSYVGY